MFFFKKNLVYLTTIISWIPQVGMLLEVRSTVNKAVAEATAWSLRIAAAGLFPEQGFYGEDFEAGTYRYKLQGKQISDGWRSFGEVRSYPWKLEYTILWISQP